jgi:hypothetical protein
MSQQDSSCKCKDHAMATKELKEKLVEKEILAWGMELMWK